MKSTSEQWQYIPLSHYHAPDHPATEKVKTSLYSLWRRFWPEEPNQEKEEKPSPYCPLPAPLLADVLPRNYAEDALASLTAILDPWLEQDQPASLARVVVGPPGSGVSEVVAAWASRHSAHLLTPPAWERILDAGADYWQSVRHDEDAVLVIPELERYFLRHHDGLDIARQLVEWLAVTPRRIIVGCDSWAWAFLSRTVQIEAVLREPIALQALDGDGLRDWFRPLPRGRRLIRSARNNEIIYPLAMPSDAGGQGNALPADDPDHQNGSEIFERIAAISRGIPDIALALWREMLCESDPDSDVAEEKSTGPAESPDIRVRPPQDLSLPSLPPGSATRESVILHTLLIHAGLPAAVLFHLVPFPTSIVIARLMALRDGGLVSEIAGRWRVTLLGYPAVRNAIESEGLLVDAF